MTISLNIKMMVLAGVSALVLQSCLKDKNGITNYTDAETLKPSAVVEIPEGGMGNFAASALNLSSPGPDTIIFHVNLASTTLFNKDLTVTIGYDANALTGYNASSTI